MLNYLSLNYCTNNHALLSQLSIITWLILFIYFSRLYFSFSCEEGTQHFGDSRPLQLQPSRLNKFYWLTLQQNICRLSENGRRGITCNCTIWYLFLLVYILACLSNNSCFAITHRWIQNWLKKIKVVTF